jgi:hypothetical protein
VSENKADDVTNTAASTTEQKRQEDNTSNKNTSSSPRCLFAHNTNTSTVTNLGLQVEVCPRPDQRLNRGRVILPGGPNERRPTVL